MQAWIQEFLDHLQATRSPHTVRAYGSDLAQLAEFTGGQPDLSPETLEKYLRAYAPQPTTRGRKLSTLRAFVRYLRAVGHLDVDPTATLVTPIKHRPLPAVLTAHQAGQLLDQPPPGKSPLRDAALLEMLYGAGLRASEVVRLDLSDVDLNTQRVRVRVAFSACKTPCRALRPKPPPLAGWPPGRCRRILRRSGWGARARPCL